MSDLLAHLEFLCAFDYTVDVLTTRHRVTVAEARKRAKFAVFHTRIALRFIEQAFAGPDDVAFLPLYYSVLNLLKTYVACTSYYTQLSVNRWHGVTYDVNLKKSQSLLTEEIVLRNQGVIPLFYLALTGSNYGTRRRVRLGEIYPYVADIGLELDLAKSTSFPFKRVQFDIEETGGKKRPLALIDWDDPQNPPNASSFKVLTGYTRLANSVNTFAGTWVTAAGKNNESIVRSSIRSFLLYHPFGEVVVTPSSSGKLLFPEEIPIALLFFHLGSVVRYKPEFLARLHDSRFWPVVLIARRHAFFKFLLLFWSFVQQQNVSFDNT